MQRWLNNYEPVVVEGRHEPIIDEELFLKCQEVRNSKKTRTRSDQTLKNPFASIMFLADYDTSPEHDARKDELEMLRAELGKKSMMLERACEAYETGVYDRQTYLERVQKVNAARAELQTMVEELEASIEESEERHEKAVPILTRVVEEMHTLEPKEQNDLLKMIVDRIEYEKTESGAAIEPTLRISLKI